MVCACPTVRKLMNAMGKTHRRGNDRKFLMLALGLDAPLCAELLGTDLPLVAVRGLVFPDMSIAHENDEIGFVP